MAIPPPDNAPLETLSDEELIQRALEERAERMRKYKMELQSADPDTVWTDYSITNRVSGKTYRVALRGFKRGESYCSCPDFRVNTLGTCKHIMYVQEEVKRRFPRHRLQEPYRQENICVALHYGQEVELMVLLPHKGLEGELGSSVMSCCPISLMASPSLSGPDGRSLPTTWGLAKPCRGSAWQSFLPALPVLKRVLVVCPASVKSQWRIEIERFTERSCQLVVGSAAERAAQYEQGSFFTLCNYEQVLRDIEAIERVPWDLIILDEGQRIKNWEAKTSRTIKGLKSPYALVLTGTPLENRLEELYSVAQFIDNCRLGPAFQFYHRHRVVSEEGRLLGYKNLDELRKRLKPLLLHRTRMQVNSELPERSTEIRRIPPTAEQTDIHDQNKKLISTILNKKYISEAVSHYEHRSHRAEPSGCRYCDQRGPALEPGGA